MIASLLIITLLAGIGFQLRRWIGKQPWYMGVGFVIFLYVPALTGAVGALSALGMPVDAANRGVLLPVLSGLLSGALCLCSSGALMPGATEEVLRVEEAETSKAADVDPAPGRKSTRVFGGVRDKALQSIPSRTQVSVALGGLFLAGILLFVLWSSTKVGNRLVAFGGEEESNGRPLNTREVKVDLPGIPSSARLQVPIAFTTANSPRRRAREALTLAAVRPDTHESYSKLLYRNWAGSLLELTMLAIGQPENLKGDQGNLTPGKWQTVLKKSRDMSSSSFPNRLDSLQARFERIVDSPGFEVSSPAAIVREGNLVVYKTVEVTRDGENIRQLTARKVMYDSGYCVFADIAVSTRGGQPVDSLASYVRATTFSIE